MWIVNDGIDFSSIFKLFALMDALNYPKRK